MKRLRVLRALRLIWPLAFIAPLWTVAMRLCWESPAHVALSGVMALHERLPALLVAAALASIGVVLVKVAHVRASLRTLQSLAGPVPPRLLETLAAESARLGVEPPALISLDVMTPMCYTLAPGPTILLSRGFTDELTADELAIVVRHELAHVARRDPQSGLVWHLVFSALLIPGFGELERWLYDRRERRAHRTAGTPSDGRFAALAARVRSAESGLERSLGHAYAGAFARAPVGRYVFVRPALALGVLAALFASHAIFLQALPALSHHHC